MCVSVYVRACVHAPLCGGGGQGRGWGDREDGKMKLRLGKWEGHPC